jgi:two-component system CheB/CheR fusion protein
MATAPGVPTSDRAPVLVVGIGASAGGLEALERLFEATPTTTGLAFVVIQHLSPDFKSLTDDILARRTRIPIRVVEDGMPVQRDTIYLLPPKKDMIISGGRLLLTDKDPTQTVALPIDHFLRSLAHDVGDRAVAVILSGTGSDGSRGVRDIHDAHGLVIVQDLETAKFDGMPRSALDTGVVDLVLPPEAIPEAIIAHSRVPHRPPVTEPAPPTGVDAVFQLLRDAYGIDFSFYKPETVGRRLERRLGLSDISSLDEYIQRLSTDPAELNLLYKDLMIGVTRFFRDEDAFERLGRDCLPPLINRLSAGEEFRVWVAGCATGEEAYSLAILIREALDTINRPVSVKIFATDAHRASLDTAGIGLYPESALASVSPERINRFFTRVSGGYQVTADLRKMVVFAQHNVLKDAPFTRLDLVSCRNLLIYFQPQAQKRVVSLFHFALKTGGLLFLGPSETTGEISDEFEAVDTRWRIYRKRRDVRLVTDLRPPAATSLRPVTPPHTTGPDPHLAIAYDALLDEFMPPALLVSERGDLVQSFSGASRFLKFRDGRMTSEILEIVDPELRTALTGALPRAFKDLTEVTYKGLRLFPPEGEREVNVTVRPVRNRKAGVTHALVLLQEVGQPRENREPPREIDLGQASREQILALENELRHTRENLQAMIEEMETSNEELQATNQELTAANEELQSTNEELHSVNEELYTVNGEYQRKIAELSQLSADLDNLLFSTEVHTIFLDRNLCLRKFTPKIAETFHLLPQDIGRRIDHFTYTIDHPGLLADLQQVLENPVPIERQVRDRRGRWFLLRCLPYRAGLTIDGVVLTLIDISEVKKAEAESRRKDEQLAGILNHSPNWLFIKDLSGRYMIVGEAFRKAVGQDPVGKTAFDLFPPEVARALTAGDDRVITQETDDQTEVIIPLADGPHVFLATKFPVRDETGRVIAIGGIKTDITPIRRAEQLAQEAVAQRERFLAMLSHELRNPLAAILNTVELARRSTTATTDVDQWIGVIARRARHMSRLIDDLLEVARFTHNKVELRRRVLDLAALVPDVLEEVRGLFDEAQVQLHYTPPTQPLWIDGDPDRLEQVQVNLLRNAAKYTPAGGQVWLTLGHEGNDAVIRVRDTGVGLTPAMMQKIFEPFVQADETLDRAGGGIGVGLTLVRWIIELHGGRVEATSEGMNRGSEFIVRLPRTQPPASLPPAASEASAGELSLPNGTTNGTSTHHNPPLRIIVVEDDPDIRRSLVELLQLDGYTVRACGNALECITALDAERFDIALIDIGLPQMSGYELARRILNRPKIAPYMIALTGYGRPEDQQAMIAVGFNDYLIKPFQPDELTKRLHAAIETLRLRTAPQGAKG